MSTHPTFDSATVSATSFVVPSEAVRSPVDQERIEQLAWQMLDGCLSPSESEAFYLELQACPAALKVYLDVVQLDANMREFFAN